ncbi:hypothetical protein V7114_06860 [Neobacillus niacini]|uniref:hypothetical protein n=1 Tax=Neobacillus niacini TaxID=86668 RepID=UPI002FFF5023
MTNKEKMLLMGAIDDLLIHEAEFHECFTDDERALIADWTFKALDSTSPKDIREGFTELARKLYEEVRISIGQEEV